ncbi:hypothetical protein [Streptomyces sp. 3213.3]|uniref:hypothetical protein n=1 Tax=Streptomyces sp. 3213.3 TaxID=1855348 RepID=UPI000A95D120|nr:hypothetical protein [Streptomyces sp. 3213.3]
MAGRAEETVEGDERASEVYREFEDWYGAGEVLHNLALVHEDAGRRAAACACWLQAADAYTRANAPAEAAQARTRAEAITP